MMYYSNEFRFHELNCIHHPTSRVFIREQSKVTMLEEFILKNLQHQAKMAAFTLAAPFTILSVLERYSGTKK